MKTSSSPEFHQLTGIKDDRIRNGGRLDPLTQHVLNLKSAQISHFLPHILYGNMKEYLYLQIDTIFKRAIFCVYFVH